jgi:hypothetical protein
MSIVDSFTKPVHASYVYGCALHAERGSQDHDADHCTAFTFHLPLAIQQLDFYLIVVGSAKRCRLAGKLAKMRRTRFELARFPNTE